MTAERTYLAGWGSTGKTRTTAHRRYNVWAAHRTRLGTGGALRRGAAGCGSVAALATAPFYISLSVFTVYYFLVATTQLPSIMLGVECPAVLVING